jgi:hypothetical protein
MNLADLRAARDETAVAHTLLRDQMSNEISQRLEEAKRQISREVHDKYNVELERAFKARTEAFTACQKAEVAAAAENAPVPVGTKLIGWGYPKYAGYGAKREAQVTGVLEVYSNSTQVQANARRKMMLSPGVYIVRLLKKDNTPGAIVERYGVGKYVWLPEGETPKEGK